MTAVRWNSNLHALDRLLVEVPAGASTGLDVGCGEGETARRLRARIGSVVGIDPDRASIEQAEARGDDISYLVADLATADLAPGSFDVVTAVAMLHHVDQRTGLERLAELVRPGGVLLVVGLAQSATLRDYLRDTRDVIGVRRHSWTKGVWETPSPKVWPPPLTYGETRRVSLDVLPDARFERVPYFRYSLIWSAPTGEPSVGLRL